MANPSRYRTIAFQGGRILEAREMSLLQSISAGKDANGNTVSNLLTAVYRQGAALNLAVTTNGTIVTVSAKDPNFPMLVFVRDRWEVITGSDFSSLDIGASRSIYLNYSLRIVTSTEDTSLVDLTNGSPTANMGELDLSFSVTDTSGVALNPSTQLEKNTAQIVFLSFAAGGPPLVPVQLDNVNGPAFGDQFRHGLVKLTTNTSAGQAVASDDPILNSNRNPNAGSVVDASVRTPVPLSGQFNTDGSARFDLTSDPGGINSDKIIVQTLKERLTDYLALLLSKINTLSASLTGHIGQRLGLSNTHPMPTYIDVGAAPLSHTSLPFGVSGSHPPTLNGNTGGFAANQTAVSAPSDLAFGVFTNGTRLAGIQRNGDFISNFLTTLSVAPGGAPLTHTGAIGTLFQLTEVVRDHVNQTNGSTNPHGVSAATLGMSTVMADPGSITLPGGLIVKWVTGTYSASAYNNSLVHINFNASFPNACLFAMVGCATTGGDLEEQSVFILQSKSASGVNVYSARNADHGGNAIAPTILAIGH